MTAPLIVIGAGGFGRETLDVIDALAETSGRQCSVAILDDSPRDDDLERLRQRGANYVGTIDNWTPRAQQDSEYLLAIGDPAARRAVAERLKHYGRPADPVVHPAATIGSMVTLGPGSVVCAGARISTNVRSGLHTHINPGAIIGHDCTLGDFVSVNPGAVVSGAVFVSDGVLIGAAATVLQGLTVGPASTIGAAACVTRDVPSGVVVKGVPAK